MRFDEDVDINFTRSVVGINDYGHSHLHNLIVINVALFRILRTTSQQGTKGVIIQSTTTYNNEQVSNHSHR